ncbi:Phytochrome-like protein cph1 [Posidoniimonas polymericola]|uniref:histidine kinase n=1 Tax=Posidoniimonas polymericola TaxID=2528002 RepID=A0A5C5YSJ5_9BACT|nr:ATP-binding protein [Posidoniimonas polymericola]TWT77888.1 Phytochrome-like protein cph1 [Posidoniimonas polymericola]
MTQGERNCIVVIDDDSVDREQIVRLVGQRYAVVQAGTAAEGIDICREKLPLCVLLDYRLPDLNGLDALNILAALGPPVVIMTGQGDEELAAESIKQGAYDYLVKQRLNADRLHSVIDHAVEKSRLIRRLEDARGDLNGVFGVASSRLREPLAEIEGQLHRLLEDADEPLPAAHRAVVSRLTAAAGDLRLLVDQLLDFNRVGRDDEPIGDADLDHVMTEVGERLRGEFQSAGATPAVGRLPIIRGSESDYAFLLENLLTNAIRYRAEHPLQVSVNAEFCQREWVIRVEDNGLGVPPDDAELVFAPHVRLSPRADIPGHGLGLATCRKIVRRHGGKIWVEPSSAGGAAFCFTAAPTQAQLNNWLLGAS